VTNIFIVITAVIITAAIGASPSVNGAEPNRQFLKWGADVQSGAPFAYKSPDDPNKVIGFESEIVEALASELGMEPVFVQNQWDGLIEGLKRKDYDIVINGLEITPERANEVQFSQPYYITAEALTVRQSNNDIFTMADLENRRVGTLQASLAQKILQEQKFKVEIVPYAQEVHAYGDLVLSTPMEIWYWGVLTPFYSTSLSRSTMPNPMPSLRWWADPWDIWNMESPCARTTRFSIKKSAQPSKN
jgi:polar amino acid transport system substrate-binding protein